MAELFHPGIIGDSDRSNRSRYIIKKLFCSFFSFSLIFNPNPVIERELLHPRYFTEFEFYVAVIFTSNVPSTQSTTVLQHIYMNLAVDTGMTRPHRD